MKKVLALIIILSINLVVFVFWQSSATKADASGPIPENAIRLRILANSDSPADQTVKRQVRDAVNGEITGWVQDLKSSGQAEKVIRAHMPQLRQTVERTLKQLHANSAFKIKLGKADFPTKMYGSYVYPAGNYQALVISLGDGKGANWWCVLFPPLCFLDFSNSEAVRNNTTADPSTSTQSTVQSANPDDTQASSPGNVQQPVSQPDPGSSGSAGQPKNTQDQVEVHFFIVDFFSKIWHSVTK
ncbi:stage II sporulation protein R [Sporolactobacillus pectinivorans]|uniref:stage II sporulation protein R n=1 Tax=Sporolactobacillus pectinivorans TaxID=1591408 RepID=UPI000C25C091|nr:stage II sporulation protein R [Sporolactobacillus pectinivorans]